MNRVDIGECKHDHETVVIVPVGCDIKKGQYAQVETIEGVPLGFTATVDIKMGSFVTLVLETGCLVDIHHA